MNPARIFIILILFACPALSTSGKTAADIPDISLESADEDGVYLTRSEFEAFLREYRNNREAPDAISPSVFPQTPEKCLAWQKGKFKFTLYGYVNLSMSYDSQKVLSGDYCAYAFSPEQDDGNSFQVDAKSSRFGVLIDGPGIPGWHGSKTQGCYEFDFQGAFSIRSRPGFMMRKAYVAVSDKDTKFLAGQDWEVISPLYPMTLNYTAGAAVGNNGYRRAMVKMERRFDWTKSTDLFFQFALTDNVLRDASGVAWAAAHSGGWPVIQGRFAYILGKNRPGNLKPVTLGISAHLGEQRFEFRSGDPTERPPGRKYFKTWSFNVDLDLPFTERLRVQAEYFLGENLSGVEGGILQGVDIYRRRTVRSQGGWIGLQYFWTKKLQTNVCYSIDDPFNDDLLGGNGSDGLSRTYNHCLFVNAMYNWNEALMTGLEVGVWRTHWQKFDTKTGAVTPMRPGEPVRIEFVTRYTF